MTERSDLEAALHASAAAPTPLPDAQFVDALERRLGGAPTGAVVVPFARRARRLSAGVVIAATVTFAGVAAAAGIVVTHPFRDEAVAPTTEPTTTTVAETTTSSTVAATEPVTVPATVRVTVPITLPITVPITEPPHTTPPTHEPTTSTEVHIPATMSLSCIPVAGPGVQCTWSQGPAGTGHYMLLRSDGHAFVNIENTLTFTDTTPVVGTVTYLVHAMSFNPNSVSLAHSGPVAVTCC